MLMLLLALQTVGGEPAGTTNSHLYLSRCLAAGQAMQGVMDRLEAERGIDMGAMKARTANFNAGIEGLRRTAAEREDLTDERIAGDRQAAGEAVTGVPLRDVLAMMDGCEAAHEVMD